VYKKCKQVLDFNRFSDKKFFGQKIFGQKVFWIAIFLENNVMINVFFVSGFNLNRKFQIFTFFSENISQIKTFASDLIFRVSNFLRNLKMRKSKHESKNCKKLGKCLKYYIARPWRRGLVVSSLLA
jgi:hypothetical protein